MRRLIRLGTLAVALVAFSALTVPTATAVDNCDWDPTSCDPGDPPPPPPPPPPTPQYRLVGQVYQIESHGWDPVVVDVRGWSRFETSSGVKVNASYLSVACYAGGSSDQDEEDNAGFTDVEFDVGPAPRGYVYTATCYHRAVHAGVTYTATSTGQIHMI